MSNSQGSHRAARGGRRAATRTAEPPYAQDAPPPAEPPYDAFETQAAEVPRPRRGAGPQEGPRAGARR
ncbi:hypothetical protein ABZ389_35115, partial [Streptomyces sp. NPDC005877]